MPEDNDVTMTLHRETIEYFNTIHQWAQPSAQWDFRFGSSSIDDEFTPSNATDFSQGLIT